MGGERVVFIVAIVMAYLLVRNNDSSLYPYSSSNFLQHANWISRVSILQAAFLSRSQGSTLSLLKEICLKLLC